MGQLENMQIFAKVVEAGSITKAAEQLNLAKSAVSKRLNELEQRLGVKLINRTTRKSSLTEAGITYFRQSKLILDEVDELNGKISSTQQNLNGILKLAAPLSFGVLHLVSALDQFAALYPELRLDINFSDRKIDLIEEGFDLAIRIGKLQDSTLQARAIAPIRHILCASPDYIAQSGLPLEPADLKSHKFLRYNRLPLAGIELIDNNSRLLTAHIDAHITSNNGDFLKVMAVSGHGIVCLPSFIIWKELATGALQPILPEYTLPTMQAYAIYPESRFLAQKVRVLIDYLTEYFGDAAYWDAD